MSTPSSPVDAPAPRTCSATNRRTARGLSRFTPMGGSSSKLNSMRTIHSLARPGSTPAPTSPLLWAASTNGFHSSMARRIRSSPMLRSSSTRMLSLMPRGRDASRSSVGGRRSERRRPRPARRACRSLSTSAAMVSTNADARWSSAVLIAWSRLPSALCTVPRDTPAASATAVRLNWRGPEPAQRLGGGGQQRRGTPLEVVSRRRAFEHISDMCSMWSMDRLGLVSPPARSMTG